MKTENTNIIGKLDIADAQIRKMFEAGAHYAYSRAKRHPSTAEFLFGAKNGIDIFDLEKTTASLEEVKKFIQELFATGPKQILFVGSKSEIKDIVKTAAEIADMPFVTNRWVGGTLTNFENIKKRTEKFQKLTEDKEAGNLLKYTKKERGKLDEEIEKLRRRFSGIVSMKTLPAAMFVVDPRYEMVAVAEARQKNIPIIAIANSDCNVKEIQFPILANDTSPRSVKFFVEEIATACKTKTTKIQEDKL